MRTHLFSWLLASFAAISLAAPLAADDKAAAQAGAESNAGPKVEVASTFRASDLMAMDVRNKQGKDIGSIEDLVVELKSGEIRYAALSFGGFAGFNDKLFAVPWKAIEFKFDEDDRFLVVDVSEEKLEKAHGFNENEWPNMADEKWAAQADKDFSPADEAQNSTEAKAKKEAGTKREGENIVYDAVYRVSSLKGMEVKNKEGKDLGTIDELVFNVRDGRVAYAALSHGGVLGVGDKLFAIPFEAFTLVHKPDEKFFVLNVSEKKLEAARGFDENDWPDVADADWAAELDKHYEISRKPKDASRRE